MLETSVFTYRVSLSQTEWAKASDAMPAVRRATCGPASSRSTSSAVGGIEDGRA